LFPATRQSYRDQTVALELHRTYDFLIQFHDEFEPLHTQLLACRHYVSLMDALAEVCNEETYLRDASLLQSSTILATRTSYARPTAHVPLASLKMHLGP
jgi:hypothetical protein